MPKKILLVDDSSTARLRSRSILDQMHDVEVVSASDGQEGVEKAIEVQPNLILMDVEMPRVNGFEACKMLKQNAATAKIPVLLMTTRTGDAFVQKGFDSGCTDYLSKPLSADELIAAMKKHLK